jgi:hypothetical protein
MSQTPAVPCLNTASASSPEARVSQVHDVHDGTAMGVRWQCSQR